MSAPSTTEGPSLPGVDRAIPELARSPRSKRWTLMILGLTVCSLVVFRWVPRSEKPPTQPADATAAVRLRAPKIEPPPDEEALVAAEEVTEPCLDPTRTSRESAVAEVTPLADPDPFAQAWEAELRKRALEASDAQKRLAEKRRRSSVVVFDDSARRTAPAIALAASANPSDAQLVANSALLDPFQRGRLERADWRGTVGSLDGLPPGAESSQRDEPFGQEALEPVSTVRAQRIRNPSTVVPQGTLIRGVLETAIQSDLPGMVRAQVTEPVYAFDGTPAVPRGATLIGRYQSGLVRGQTRVFVIWSRLLRPDGVSIQLASPGTDLLGRTGVAGEVDTHFFERFSSSIVLSLIDGGLAIAASNAQNSDNTTIIQGGGRNLKNAAELALENSVNIPPTVEVARGTPIQVFVAQDLDFVVEEPIRRDLLERRP
jgi:type IV secretory pathway VirB10-like protein